MSDAAAPAHEPTAADPEAAVAAAVEQLVATRHVPLATYRLQLNRDFPFAAAAEQAGYLAALGVSDVYASPILQARPGSPHGYDATDPSRISDDLGGADGFDQLSEAVSRAGLGMILDVVPNHMAVDDPSNRWWMDVLEHGTSSRHAAYFDIDWHPVNPELANKVLLPILGEHYGKTLESGQLRLLYENGAFSLAYYDRRFPVAPETYSDILTSVLSELTEKLGPENEYLLEYRSIITALSHLPAGAGLGRERQAERYREVMIVKRRLAALVEAEPEVRAAIDAAVALFNGRPGEPDSFDRLDRLVTRQSYRPAFWRVATDEINYRRFFDVNSLAAVRVEVPAVFDAVHAVPLRLLAEGKARGLRVDHPDGLYAPTRYFRELQERYTVARLRDQFAEGRSEAELRRLISRALADRRPQPLYVVAEKILGEGEPLPADWSVDGTVGYDFLVAANGLFVAGENAGAADDIYTRFVGRAVEFGPLVRQCKQHIMRQSMASEVTTLSHQLDRIAERNRHYRDFTLSNLRFALREFVASLEVYRTYTTAEAKVSERDAVYAEAACEEAKRLNPTVDEEVFDFLRDTVLLRNLGEYPAGDRAAVIDWVLRFQQVTGPVMAKGIEDTAFYVYNRLASLNEVGGHPQRFGTTVEEFHALNAARVEHWPHAMLATTTHDTKRSEDVRARINVLSELPGEWERAANDWRKLLTAAVRTVGGSPAPSPDDRYLFFQTVAGTWPDPPPTDDAALAAYRDRLLGYMEKATKEAKQHTSWVRPNSKYDAAVRAFVAEALAGPGDRNPFLAAAAPFARRVAFFGRLNSLAQVVLKFTSPGVPDVYQGNELWDFSLVDPDNRRPVDYAARRAALDRLRPLLDGDPPDLADRVAGLLAAAETGEIKLYLTAKALRVRARRRAAFDSGVYTPLAATGPLVAAVCAFALGPPADRVVSLACVRPVAVTGGREEPPVGDAWGETRVLLPDAAAGERWCDALTGRVTEATRDAGGTGLRLRDVFGTLHTAILERRD